MARLLGHKLLQSLFFGILTLTIVLAGCEKGNVQNKGRKIYVRKEESAFELYKDNKPFFIKGAAGFTYLDILARSGGNAIRTWDTNEIEAILDSAHKHNLVVMVGLSVVDPEEDPSFYKQPSKVNRQFRIIKNIVNTFKNHPSVLMWCVGNELNFPNPLLPGKFYSAFNNIVDMIHLDDPDHPVTTTVLNFSRRTIVSLKLRCNIDVISFNIFNSITHLKEDLKRFAWFWNGPYLVSEWGVDGPWEGTEKTIWGTHIEATSTKKAEIYSTRYSRHMPLDDERFLGSFVFYWGNKQETTQSWFSLFDRNGYSSEAIGTMQYLWTKKPSRHRPPQVNYMLINKKGARDNILLSTGERTFAEVLLLKPDSSISKVVWEIMQEDWFKKRSASNTTYFESLGELILSSKGLRLNFIAPRREGPYRIFATIYDKYGNFSTCNTPVYVLSK
ncbi:glycoside hydrolase family 2 TIM barrel-domain containing protein [Arcticibacter tournemirensis]